MMTPHAQYGADMFYHTGDSGSDSVSPFQSSSFPTKSSVGAELVTKAPPPSSATASSSLEVSKSQSGSHLGPRKGHKKSRGGCFHCKRRKIKCQETLPSCINCMRRSLDCKYPEVKPYEVDIMTAVRSQVGKPSAALQSTPTLFTLDDMRFFHHFIQNAYPHLPVNNTQVWITQVPAFSHGYDYLMHAMLGLAATHLSAVTNVDYSDAAYSHRLRALHGFNKALSKKPEKEPDGDAILATIYTLTFQSAFMKDSLAEFLTMVRGCVILSAQLKSQRSISFFDVDGDAHLKFMEPRLVDLPSIDPTLAEGAAESLEALSFVLDDELNSFYYHNLTIIVDGIKASSKLGYWRLVNVYNEIGILSDAKFTEFASPDNTIGLILISHFMALEVVLLPLLERQYENSFPRNQLLSRFGWFDTIEKSLAPELQKFIQWPGRVLKQACEEWKATAAEEASKVSGFILAKTT